MKSNYKKLGDLIRQTNNRNSDYTVSRVCGISMKKYFIPSIANTNDVDLSNYKVIKTGEFGCILMKIGRDNKLSVAYHTDPDSIIISPAYFTFEIIDRNELLPEFLMIFFLKPETDRLLGFMSAGSMRGSLTWEEFCELEIPVPDIEIQKNVVAVYNELLRNQKCYEGSLDDLQLICDTFIEDLAKKKDLKRLGDYIQQSEYENYGLPLSKVRGVSIHKVLIKPKANMTDVELSGYKLLKIGQFVFNPNTARMGERIPIALNTEEDFIVSKIYPVFEITKIDELLPEFLYLWFTRPDFDRYARFHSWGSARETFNWEDMCEVRLPIPDIEVQKSIVAIHHVLESRKKLNEDLKNIITPLCPVLMKGVVDTLTTK